MIILIVLLNTPAADAKPKKPDAPDAPVAKEVFGKQQRPAPLAARARLAQVSSAAELSAHAADLTAENIEELLEPATIVLDGTDNFETRYLLNDYAVDAEVPLVLGGAVARRGTVLP
ncbi:MAG: hypothetical protein HC850_05295, partial [Rhodomicrobium sp.]|nr:hypothetical protein [Rhodomicrobium sp.]